jgi:hypothetical protein
MRMGGIAQRITDTLKTFNSGPGVGSKYDVRCLVWSIVQDILIELLN